MTKSQQVDGGDAETVASLLVPDDTPQAPLVTLFDALDDAGFGIGHHDGFDSQEAVAYDLTSTDSIDDVVPDPGPPEDYDSAFKEARTDILSGPAFEAAVAVLAAHMTAATQYLVDAEAADPDFGDPDRMTLESAFTETETQVTDVLYERVLNNVEIEA